MTQITLHLPETAFALLRKDPEEMADALRQTAAVKWYELGLISQERAAEIAGLSRGAFITALSRFQVCPLQYTPDELHGELQDAD
ncbi:MAG: UPF0175 family protein [Candidatus Contendobacter sp.]|nr:UPF0175 family protein [Candidatus Contendobacter sp.]